MNINNEELIKIAKRSTHRRFLTGALIFNKKGEVLSRGWSHTGFKMTNLLSIHAEMHCLWRARHLDLNDCSIFVMTISGRSGNITTSRPCLNCAVALRSVGIDKIYYSLPGGVIFGPTDFDEELDRLKDYSVENNFGKLNWQPPDWAIPNKKH
jgi:tRNA(Arg) A34 adenosine deaminase TadA